MDDFENIFTGWLKAVQYTKLNNISNKNAL